MRGLSAGDRVMLAREQPCRDGQSPWPVGSIGRILEEHPESKTCDVEMQVNLRCDVITVSEAELLKLRE